MSLQVQDFAAFFEEVHGHRPYAWQDELCRQVCERGWPAALDVPTGMGKTAVLDIAVFALALQARQPAAQRSASTRTFLVVDRRVIVDQAHERAQALRRALQEALRRDDGSAVAAVAASLDALSGPGSPVLDVARLRGGITWSSRWLRSARQPAVVTGTVDQLGSRLLFRGYGVTPTMRPIDAALCGADSLVLLDEAHLARPFLATLAAVGRYEALAERPVMPKRPVRSVLLSATMPQPADRSLDDVFRCNLSAETSVTARARLDAIKDTTLLSVKAGGRLADVLAALARLDVGPACPRVAVVVNTVALAREVFSRLQSDGDQDPRAGYDAALLIGRCRDVERERNSERFLRDRLTGSSRPDDRPLIVVATQTVEVGADIDVDALITEACPLDALTQRLGRLNRAGRRPVTSCTVVHDASVHDKEQQTPVYGRATGATWRWLVERATGTEVRLPAVALAKVAGSRQDAPRLDLGISGVLSELSSTEKAGLSAEPALEPAVLSPVLDLWARTSPSPVPDQEVGPFLHGLEPPRPEVRFCWRAGLPEGPGANEAWEEELSLRPPSAHETVSVSYAEALRVLGRGDATSELSDAEGALEPADDLDFDELPAVRGCVWENDGSVTMLDSSTRLRPDSTVVLDSEEGGHDGWGWTGALDGACVPDAADLGPIGLRTLRLRPEIWRPWLSAAAMAELDSASWRSGPSERDNEEVWRIISAVADAAPIGDDVEEAAQQAFRDVAGSRAPGRIRWTHLGWPMVTVPRGRSIVDGSDIDRPAASSESAVPITLSRHLRDVEVRARGEAEALGLDPAIIEAIALAALAHDLGKADRRFQLVLHGGDPYRLDLADEPLAKSARVPTTWAERQDVSRRSSWPQGMRHEAVSAALVRDLRHNRPELFEGLDAELVEHLVVSHHGRARPLLPAVVDQAPEPVVAELPSIPTSTARARSDDSLVDWSQPARFERLNAQYGRWGLALLEAVVRLSDMAVSEEYQAAGS